MTRNAEKRRKLDVESIVLLVFFVWAIISAAWWWPLLVDVLNNNGPIGPFLEAMQIAFLPLIGLRAFALVCYLAVVGIRGALANDSAYGPSLARPKIWRATHVQKACQQY